MHPIGAILSVAASAFGPLTLACHDAHRTSICNHDSGGRNIRSRAMISSAVWGPASARRACAYACTSHRPRMFHAPSYGMMSMKLGCAYRKRIENFETHMALLSLQASSLRVAGRSDWECCNNITATKLSRTSALFCCSAARRSLHLSVYHKCVIHPAAVSAAIQSTAQSA